MKSFNCVRSKTPNPSASASQNSKLGGDNLGPVSTAFQSYGAIKGAKMAPKTINVKKVNSDTMDIEIKPTVSLNNSLLIQKARMAKKMSQKDLAQKLLVKSQVAVVQGSAFGLDGYFRISYATSTENLKKAMERIKSFCGSLT